MVHFIIKLNGLGHKIQVSEKKSVLFRILNGIEVLKLINGGDHMSGQPPEVNYPA